MCQLSAFQLLHKPCHKNCLQWKKYEASPDFIAPSDIPPHLCVYTSCSLSSTTLFHISTCLNYLPTNTVLCSNASLLNFLFQSKYFKSFYQAFKGKEVSGRFSESWDKAINFKFKRRLFLERIQCTFFQFPPHLVKPNFFVAPRFLNVAFLELNFRASTLLSTKTLHKKWPWATTYLELPIPSHWWIVKPFQHWYLSTSTNATLSLVLCFCKDTLWNAPPTPAELGELVPSPVTQPCSPSFCFTPFTFHCTCQGVIP